MRYMILVIPKGYESVGPNAIPDVEALKKMQAFNKELLDAGVLLALDGLDSPVVGARVTFDTGKPVVTDGPFAEAKEVLGGYWLIDVGSREEAIGWAEEVAGTGRTVEVVRRRLGVYRFVTGFPESEREALRTHRGVPYIGGGGGAYG